MALRRIIPAICLLLLLSGCAADRDKAPLPTESPAMTETPSPAPTGAHPPTPLVTEAVNTAAPTLEPPMESTGDTPIPTPAQSPGAVTTEDEIRAKYEKEYFRVDKITPYNGDFLVQYGDGPWFFDWVYGKTGERHRIMECGFGVRDVEILEPGVIQVLTDGVFYPNGYRGFPSILTGYSAVRLDENGRPLPYEREMGNFTIEKYWADISEASSFGRTRREALTNALVDVTGAQFVFGPMADREGFESFYTASSTLPATEISFDEESRVMTLTFRETLLSSGDLPEFSDEQEERRYRDSLSFLGLTLPTEFPAGEFYGSNPYISRASIEEDGSDTVVKLYLTEKAEEYTVEAGKVGSMDNGPYIRIILREHGRW